MASRPSPSPGDPSAPDAGERFRMVVEAAPFGLHFYRLEPDDRLVFLGANAAADRILQVSHEAFVGKTIEEAFPGLVGTELPDRYREVARTRVAWHAEQVTYDGESITGAFEVHAFPTTRGEMAAGFQDISVRKRADAGLAREKDRLAVTLRSIGDAVIVTDAGGFITLMNRIAEQLTGWRAAEAEGGPLELVFRTLSEPAGEPEESPVHRALRGEARAGHHSWLVARDGTRRPIWHRASRIEAAAGEVSGAVLVFRDESAERQLQDQVQRAQKLESVGRLAGGVAHDFNNLLTVILGCAEELQEVADAALREPVEQILEAARRARDVTRQLLAFARRDVIAPRPLQLGDVIRATEPLLRRVLGEDVELVVSTPDEPWRILGDPGQVEQVLLNLAMNSRDAMPGGGRIEITLSNARVAPGETVRPDDAPGEWVRLRLRDQGTGMTPEVKAHLFEPFFTTKATGKGTGLGLATVYGIVTQGGGHLHVDSEPGRGTTFEICFPRTTAATPHAPAPLAVLARRGRERVLVVEDDAQVRAVTVRALEGAGYHVVVARDGAEALALDAGGAGPFDLVVTDVVMPGLSGRAVVDRLRQRHPGLRALFVSGYSRDVIAQRGVIEAGLQFLPKPFTSAALLEQVRLVLDGPEPSARG